MSLRKVTTVALAISLLCSRAAHAAEPVLVAIGSVNGLYEDFAAQTAGLLANNVPGNRLGGLGSGLAYLGGDWFLALPDRTPVAFEQVVAEAVSVAGGGIALRSVAGAVLLPGSLVPLHIFEQHYRQLVRDLSALPEGAPRRFGVLAIKDGHEVGRGNVTARPSTAPHSRLTLK